MEKLNNKINQNLNENKGERKIKDSNSYSSENRPLLDTRFNKEESNFLI